MPVSGSLTVTPTETTTYSITATGPGGQATDGVTIIISPITISITSPLDGATITRPDVMLQGTISNTTGNETGVVVNGVPAVVYGNEFVANLVPLGEGENIITAAATDTDGNTNTTTITIYAETPGNYIRITADTESGVSPLETTLRVDGSFSFTESSLTYTAPDVVELLDSPTENEYNVRMTTPGIYFFTAEVTDDQNNTYMDTVAVLVLDQAELDALLRAKWEGMRTALEQNDVDGAVSYFDSSTQHAYQTVFTNNPQLLVQMAQVLYDIQFIRIEENSVEYDMRATKDGTEYSFYLLFIKNEQGLWKIKSF